MGLHRKFSGRKCYDTGKNTSWEQETYSGVSAIPSPVPYRFKILEVHKTPAGVAARIHYPDCTTHGGEKICVWKGAVDLHSKAGIDPHFLGTDDSPVARFPGTPQGWAWAIEFLDNL